MNVSLHKTVILGLLVLGLVCAIGISSLAHTDKKVPEILTYTLTSVVSGLIGYISQPKPSNIN